MPAPRPERQFAVADPSTLPVPALSIGLAGPPGGGKTKSALRIADGIARVRGGKPAVIETEPGRVAKYLRSARNPNGHDFHLIPFSPPFVPEDFLSAIRAAEKLNPAAIIVDSMSDEHEGEGGVLEWHDREVPNSGGNEWAAWAKPKASRRKLIAGIEHVRTPLILTFRAREKTRTEKKTNSQGRTVDTPVNIGFSPIAPTEIVHALDLVCLLPPRANGVAVWSSAKAGEDFMIKIPEYLAGMIRQGEVLDERLGEELARWQKGDIDAGTGLPSQGSGTTGARSPAEVTDAYIARVNACADRGSILALQTEERTAKWLAGLRDKHPAQWDRQNEATAQKLAEFDGGGEDDIVYGDSQAEDSGFDSFPAGPEEG